MRNRLKLLVGAAVAIGAAAGGFVLWTTQPADAADHNDPPGILVAGGATDNPAADIDDVYAWHEGANTNIIVTYSGPTAPSATAGTEGVYSRDTQFLIHISNNADPADEHTIQVRFGTASAGRWGFQASNIPGRTTPLTGPVESLITDGAVKAYVGLRDDPFFFDLTGFQATLSSTPPTLSFMSTRDFFAGKNTTAIALQFPTAAATTNTLRVWVSSGTVTP